MIPSTVLLLCLVGFGTAIPFFDGAHKAAAVSTPHSASNADLLLTHDPTEPGPDPRFNVSALLNHPHHAAVYVSHPNSTANHLNSRAVAGMYECANHGWQGPCVWQRADGGACHNRRYDYNGCMGPDKGITCRIFGLPNCQEQDGAVDGFKWPGVAWYQDSKWLLDRSMTDGPISYRCHWA